MAVPKKKTSRARRDSRRATHALKRAPSVVECPHCHAPRLPHRVPQLRYGARQVVQVEE